MEFFLTNEYSCIWEEFVSNFKLF